MTISHKQFQKAVDFINRESLTQMQVANKQGISIRWVKEKTKTGKLHAYKLPSDTVYNNGDIK